MADELPPPLTDEEAVAEVGWVAREARRLVEALPTRPAVEWVEFYERKARLLRHISARPGVIDPDAAAQMIAKAEAMAAAWRVDVAPIAVEAAGLVDLREQLPPQQGMGRGRG